MKNNLLKTFGLFLLLTISITSCKKSKTELDGKTDALTGAWQEANMSGSIARRLVFKPGGDFTMEIWTNNYKSGEVNGTYIIDGSNLTVNINEEVEINSAGSATIRKVNRQLFEKGKFSISNDILTIKCITYPADAPVDTEFKYGKIRAID